jgi:hypothetical protein
MTTLEIIGKSVEGKSIVLTISLDGANRNEIHEREMISGWILKEQPNEIIVSNPRIPHSLIQQVIESCFSNTNIRVLSFRSSSFNALNLSLLLQLLRRNRSIESIDLFHCGNLFSLLSSEGGNNDMMKIQGLIDELLQLFLDSKYLRSLSGCTIARPTLSIDRPISSLEMEFIYADLRKNTDLKILSLCCSKVSVDSLLFSLFQNRSLLQLTLYDIVLFDINQLSMVNYQKQRTTSDNHSSKNSTLKTLRLKFSTSVSSKIIQDCLTWLSSSLIPYLSITTLQLDYLPVEDYSIQFLCDILERNKSLCHLSLFNIYWNWINWKKLTQSVSENGFLRVLRLDAKNEIDHRSRQVLGKALEHRSSPLILRYE